MSLKTLVKVSEVTNLSDARYCAGMGVEMLGFTLDENHPRFIELSKLREISTWISGIKSVGEFTGENVENMNYLAKELGLDYVQLSLPVRKEALKEIHKPLILKLVLESFSKNELENYFKEYKGYIEFFLVESDKTDSVKSIQEELKIWCKEYPIILGIGIKAEDLDIILNEIQPKGISLKGGEEIKPGLKTFDELASILEELETE